VNIFIMTGYANNDVDLDGWQNGWFWFVWGGFLRGDYLDRRTPIVALINNFAPT
jgi:hypothetical protein